MGSTVAMDAFSTLLEDIASIRIGGEVEVEYAFVDEDGSDTSGLSSPPCS